VGFWNRHDPATPERVDPFIVLNKSAFCEFLDNDPEYDASAPDALTEGLTHAWRRFIERYPDETYAPDPDDD
jgi:hypothetical protein